MNVARTASAGRRRGLAVVLRALLAAALLTATAVVVTATPAAAEGEPVANLWWVRCQDESEPFSDEPYILLNGQQIASGNNIDPGDKFYFFNNSQQTIFGPVLVLELWEDDGIWGDDHLGNFYVYASDQGQGERESYVFGNGEYILHYVVT